MMILTDRDLEDREVMTTAMEAVEEALLLKSKGALISPPRHSVAFGDSGSLVFTIGGASEETSVAGFRVYDTFKGARHEQIVAVWQTGTAELLGIITGSRLGEIRTGAIGGLAIRHMSKADAAVVGVLGSGQQARAQLEAAAAVRTLKRVRVYSRNEESRRTFAIDMERRLNISVEEARSARDVVADADIVICATSSTTPVIEASWLKAGVHINTVGPKTISGHELGLDVAAIAGTIATDSLEQMQAYPEPFFLSGSDAESRVMDLASIVSAQKPIGRFDETTLFCSVGLAGTEVLVAAKIIAARMKAARSV